MAEIPQAYRDLFDRRASRTWRPSAPTAPQVTPVWIDHDGHHIRFNTARGG
jgi:hypothetical protein